MATSSVNPMNLLATPSTSNARSLFVPDGFAESLSKAIRREDAPVARRERPQPTESDEPAARRSEKSTASAEAEFEQDNTNPDAKASAEPATVTGSRQDEQSAEELSADVVVISEQAKQQATIALPEMTAEAGAVVESIPSPTGAVQQKQESATGTPAPTSGQELPIGQPTDTTAQAAAASDHESLMVHQEASSQQSQSLASSPQDTPILEVKRQAHDDALTEEQSLGGPVGSTRPTDGSTIPQEMVPMIPVQATQGETGRNSNDDGRQSTSKVEPIAAEESAAAPREAEVDVLKLHSEGDSVVPESQERPAAHATNFPSVLERTNSLTSRRTTPTEVPSHQMPQVDAQKFINRVSRAFQVAENRGGPLQLRLSPPELGALKIELSIQQGTLTAKLETETAAAKTVLLDNLPALRERLAAQEIRIDKFEVDVRQQNSGEQPNWQAPQDGEDARHARAVATGRQPGPSQTTEAPAATATTPTRTHHNGQFSAVA